MAIQELKRVFRFNGRDLVDPSIAMKPEQVLTHYQRQYPKLLGGKVMPPVNEGATLVYEMKAAEYGSKG